MSRIAKFALLGVLAAWFLALMPVLGAAQTDEGSWENLNQLRVGQKIEVVQTDLKKLKGTFLSLTEEAIFLRVKKDEVAVQREDVFRVSLREKSKRLRNALIGLAIGAGAGVAAAEIYARREQPIAQFREDYRAIAYAVLVPVGLGVGAGIGAAIPPGYQTIYRADKRQVRKAKTRASEGRKAAGL